MQRPGASRTFRTPALCAAVLLAILVGVPGPLPGPGGHAGGPSAPRSSGGAPVALGNRLPARLPLVSASPGTVAETYVPLNGSVLPGNAQPDTNYGPEGAAYVPGSNRLLVSFRSTLGYEVIDASTGSVIGSWSPGWSLSSATEAVWDPADNLTYYTDYGDCGVRAVNVTNLTRAGWISTDCEAAPIAYDPLNHDLYVGVVPGGCSVPGTVQVINTTQGKVVANLSVWRGAQALAFDPDTGDMVVASSNAWLGCGTIYGALEAFNGTSTTPVYNVTSSLEYDSLAYDPATGTLLAGHGSTLAIVNASNGASLGNVTPGVGPYVSMVYSSTTHEIYVSDLGGLRLIALNATNESTIGTYTEWSPFGGGVGWSWPPPVYAQLAYSAATGTVYLTAYPFDMLDAFNVSRHQFVQRILTEFYPNEVLLDPSGARVLLGSDTPTGDLLLNGTSLAPVGTFGYNFGPGTAGCGTYDPRLASFLECGLGSLGVVNASSGAAFQTGAFMGNSESGVAYDSHDAQSWTVDPTWPRAYSANDSNTSNGTSFPTGMDGNGIAYDSVTNELVMIAGGNVLGFGATNHSLLYNLTVGGTLANEVANPTARALYFTNASAAGHWFVAWNLTSHRVGYRTAIGGGATGIVLAPPIDRAYVLNVPANNVTVINLTTGGVIGAVAVGDEPSAGAYDPSTDEVLVANTQSESVSVIEGPRAFRVWFNESGLPSGATWSVRVGTATSLSGNTSSLAVELPNGTYAYSVPDAGGYQASPAGGTLAVRGRPVSVDLVFSIVYPLNFSESGLPSGRAWTVSVNGTALSASGPYILFEERNGSYPYRVSGLPGWQASVYAGTVSISGAGSAVRVNWSEVVYALTFAETGLPAGSPWWVTLNGSSVETTAPSLGFTEPNGTYAYNVSNIPGWRASAYRGTAVVAGAPAWVNTTWAVARFTVTFHESGLPSGTTWSVSLGGLANSSSGPSIAFSVTNGTYAYSVAGIPGWRLANYSGSVAIQGASDSVPLDWAEVTYPVTFVEHGLPNGTDWSVFVNGAGTSTTTSSIAFADPNGTLGFDIGGLAGWRASVYAGSVVVAAASVTIPVNWTPFTYALTFQETGLPAGSPWSVDVSGRNATSTSSTLSVPETNGTYTYRLVGIPGWRTPSYDGAVGVAGSDATVAVPWSEVLYGLTFSESGLPAGTAWSVTVAGTNASTSAPSIVVPVPNGSIAYRLGNVPGWRTAAYTGSVAVAGGPARQAVVWSVATYDLAIGETGLPAGTNWSASTGTRSNSTQGPTLDLAGLANGTYVVTLGVVPGYLPSASTWTVRVAGPPAPLAVQFHATSAAVGPGPPAAGLTWTIALGAAAAAVVATAGIVVVLRRRRVSRSVPAEAPDEGAVAPPQEGD